MSYPKERILAVERIINNTPQNATEIMKKLYCIYGIECDRKSVYSDITVLTQYMPIDYIPKKGWYINEVQD